MKTVVIGNRNIHNIDMSLNKISKYLVFLTLIPAIFVFFFPGRIAMISILCTSLALISLLFYFLELNFPKLNEGKTIIYFFLALNWYILIRGISESESSGDWTFLIVSIIPLTLLFPLLIFLGMYLKPLKTFLRTFLTFGIFISSVLLLAEDPSSMSHTFSKSASVIYIFLLFSPYLNFKWKLIIYALAFVSFTSEIDSRSNMINIIVAFLISLTYFFKKMELTLSSMKILRILLVVVPITFSVLGYLNVFNVFLVGQYFSEMSIQDNGRDVMVDSRSGIYNDVIMELKKEKAILWGLGGSGKTKTFLTEAENFDYDIIYKEGRRATESGMLNYLQYSGIIGVIIYFMLFIKASYYLVARSNNWFCIMLGVWLIFRGFYSFIEDRVVFQMFSVLNFILIGASFNSSLRRMNELEVKIFLRSIFQKKYDKYLVLKNV